MIRIPSVLALFLLLLTAVGCGGGGNKSSVSGKISFDGAPVEDGTIIFVEVGGARPEASPIKNGAYVASVGPGSYKVQISASKLVDPQSLNKRSTQKEPVMHQYIPPKYQGDKTELTATVASKSGQTFDFELQSAK